MARSAGWAATSSRPCFPARSTSGLLESLARTLIEQVSRPYSIEGHRVVIGASVGIAIGDPGRSLRRQPDPQRRSRALRGQGRRPRQALLLRSRRCTARRPTARCWRTTFARRSTRGELWVAYQPIVRAAGEEICGFEALVRWNHPVRGPISPDKFIPLAEECGMIGKIGTWVLDTALEEAAHWPDHVRIAVNLSPIQFNDPDIVDIGRRRCSAESGVRADAARAGDHRGRVPRRQRRHRRDVRAAEGARRPAGARRFRHRLQLARLFEESAVRQDQDRPELRPRRRLDDQAATARSSAPSSRSPKASAWIPPPKASRPTTICT